MRKNYASRLTREELEKGGITCITEDGMVFRGEKQVNLSTTSGGYLVFNIYDLDEDGNKIKQPITRQFKGCKKPTDTYTYRVRIVGLHRAMWAWFHNEVKEGYVVDHISNQHTSIEDYHLSNLQLLTPAENLAKERDESTKQLKCKLDRPLRYYEDKLNYYTTEYEKAKQEHRANDAHHLRCNVAQTKARIRYWKAHREEAEALLKEKEENKVYKKNELYHEVARMKASVINFSNGLPKAQGKELRKFVRLYKQERDYEILKQLYEIATRGE